MSLDDRDRAECYFSVSDKDDESLWIYVSPQGKDLRIEGKSIGIGLDLKRGTSSDVAVSIAELLRAHVASVSVWTVD